MIKAIVEIISSKTDTNGNTYHFGIFYSVNKGKDKFIVVELGGGSNALYLLQEIGFQFQEMFSCSFTLPKRRWKRLHDVHKKNSVFVYEHEAKDKLKEFYNL